MVLHPIRALASQGVDYVVEMKIQQKTVEDAAGGCYDKAAPSVKNNAAVDDSQYVKKGKDAFYAARGIDDDCGKKGIQQKLKIGKQKEVLRILVNSRIYEG